jgi:lysophospholipase L1-like esterase
MYSWPSLSNERYLLLGDSLIKHINHTKHTRVISYPGARAHDLLIKVVRGEIPLARYRMIIGAVGTNDASDITMPPRLAADGIIMVMSRIAVANPRAILIISGMLIRPKDQGTQIEYRRKLINRIVQLKCREKGFYFFKTWKCLMTQSNIRDRVYARDGLHLNRYGARHVWRRLEGNIRSLEGRL